MKTALILASIGMAAWMVQETPRSGQDTYKSDQERMQGQQTQQDKQQGAIQSFDMSSLKWQPATGYPQGVMWADICTYKEKASGMKHGQSGQERQPGMSGQERQPGMAGQAGAGQEFAVTAKVIKFPAGTRIPSHTHSANSVVHVHHGRLEMISEPSGLGTDRSTERGGQPQQSQSPGAKGVSAGGICTIAANTPHGFMAVGETVVFVVCDGPWDFKPAGASGQTEPQSDPKVK